MAPTDPLDPARAPELARLPEDRLRDELDALVRQGGAAASLLQALAEDPASDKGVRKLARAALHRLRASGERVELPRERAESVLRPIPSSAEPAHVSPPDPLGQRLAILGHRCHGGADLYQVSLSDTDGVVALEVVQGSWRDVRTALRDLVRATEPGMLASVPFEEAAALVRRAALLNGPDFPSPPEVDGEALAHLVRHAGPHTPGDRARETLAAQVAGLSVVDAQATLDLRLDSGAAPLWVFGDEEFVAFAREIESIERSPLVLSESQTRDRQSERIEKFAESFFGERRRKCLSERLEELGAAWLAWADQAGACAALRVAAHLREARQPLEIPLVRRSFDLSLEHVRNAAREQEADKLIVPPA
jgi:hypothetical protein